MGVQGHFARLRLLDENRYPNMENFISEQKDYYKVAKIVMLYMENFTKQTRSRTKIHWGMPQRF